MLAQDHSTKKAVLSARNISKTLNGQRVLRNVSLDAYKSDIIALVGPSGAGKSTFLRCLNLLESPSEGSIYLRGREIEMVRTNTGLMRAKNEGLLRFLRCKVGFVFQNFNLWHHLTVLQNITEAPIYNLHMARERAETIAQELLERVGLADKAHVYPKELSGGQQQRVAIARALAVDPDVLLLDEPTSALDPAKTGEIKHIIRELAQTKSVVLVSHDLNLCRDIATKILFFNCGRVLEQGATEDLFTNPQSEELSTFLRG